MGPQSILLRDKRGKVQKKAARFVIGNYVYETETKANILEHLSGNQRKNDSGPTMLYKGQRKLSLSFPLLKTITGSHSSQGLLFIGLACQPICQSFPSWRSSAAL